VLKKELPDGWECKCLRDVISYQKGRKPKDLSEHPKGLTYLTAEALRSGKSIQYIPEEDVNDCLLSSEENLLIIWDGSNSGEVFLGKDGVVASTMAKIEVAQNSISEKYLFYYLKSKFELFNGKTTGSSIPHLNKNLFENLEIPLPPLETQRKIIAILEKAEATQGLRAEVNVLTQQLVENIFLKIFGDTIVNPYNWEKVMLNDVCGEIHRYPSFYGFNYVARGIPVLKISNMKEGGRFDCNINNYDKIPEEICEKFPRTIVDEGDIVFEARGTYIGKCAIVPSHLKGSNISPNTVRVAPDRKKLLPKFLLYLSLTKGWKTIIAKYVNYWKGGFGTIKTSDLKNVEIILPPLELQQSFVDIVDSYESLHQKQIRSSTEVENLLNMLFSKAFNGDLVA